MTLLCVLGCTESESTVAPVQEVQSSPIEVAASPEGDELTRLRLLGYVDVVEEAPEAVPVGVSQFDSTQSQPGYTLLNQLQPKAAYLINAQGEVVNLWRGEGEGHWARVKLTPDGDLLILGSDGAPSNDNNPLGRYFERQTWGGETVWRRDIPIHHDLVFTEDNHILSLSSNLESVPHIHSPQPVSVDSVIKLSMNGDVLEERSLIDVGDSRPDLFTWQPIEALSQVRMDQRDLVDLLHANAIHLLDDQELAARAPFYALGGRLVTLRHQDVVMLYSEPDGILKWVWGRGILDHPHDAQVLANGNLLVFDNGLRRGWSRILEVNPLTLSIEWEYKATPPQNFYTRARGNTQRLSNGNTLICQSNSGRIFEVTPAGETVWQYVIPHTDERGRRLITSRALRYDPAFIEGLLGE